MLTIALDSKNNQMRLHCSSGLSHDEIIQAFKNGRYAFEDVGAFYVINGTTDWKGVFKALGIDAEKAVQHRRNHHVFTAAIQEGGNQNIALNDT